MKKTLLALLCLILGKTLLAQPFTYPDPLPESERLFTYPILSARGSHFDFILPNNNRMVIAISSIQQLNTMPDLDSLFKKIWLDLQPLRDSLTDPLAVRRIDYVANGKDNKIRIKKYQPSSTYFSYKDDELVQMKVDQDTLRFKGYSTTMKTFTINGQKLYRGQEYIVMLLLNNISDLPKLPEGILQNGLTLLRKDAGPALAKRGKKQNTSYLYALYNLQTQKRISPFNIAYLGYGKRHGLNPYVQLGIQYGRGAWIPSTGVGLEYFYGKTNFGLYSFRLLWEPYFLFQRNSANKLMNGRNDFITLKFHSNMNFRPANTVEFNENFSVSYLVGRKGDWFEPNTFKFSLPGFQTRNILLEPEFFFNKLFQNLSPSLKLTMYFE